MIHKVVNRVKHAWKACENLFIKIMNKLYKKCTSKKVCVRDKYFILRTENWITKYRADTASIKEATTVDWIDKNITTEDIFWDIGANIGIFSLYALLKCDCQVFSFEPEYSNIALLKEHIMINNLTKKRISPFNIAFGDKHSISYLHIQSFEAGAALHTESVKDIQNTETGHGIVWKEGIVTYTIDTFCKELSLTPTAIKIDVDGTEEKVLMGAANTLQSEKLRTIAIETDKNTRTQCFQLLHDYKFVKKNETRDMSFWHK